MQVYRSSVICPECGGGVQRITRTRKLSGQVLRDHVCMSLVRRLGKVQECGHAYRSRQAVAEDVPLGARPSAAELDDAQAELPTAEAPIGRTPDLFEQPTTGRRRARRG